jgi:NADH-quinone oxidoreductase subunit H
LLSKYIFFCFSVRILAEMKQSPIDLVKGESELVCGFNIEYFGIKFALIIITKYAMIILFCFIVLFIFRNLLYA